MKVKEGLKAPLLLYCYLLSVFSYSQNLVPNGDFEEYVCIPPSSNHLMCAKGWINPNSSSPDYFHRSSPCCVQNSAHVPDNLWGIQEPHSGDGYACIIIYSQSVDYEYVEIPLTDNLQPGFEYELKIYVSLGEVSNVASNCLGFLFTEGSIGQYYEQINLTPQLYNKDIISDKVNWTPISMKFVADKPYDYLTIGNFFNYNYDKRFIKKVLDPYDPGWWYAIYYIDDINVTPTGRKVDFNCTQMNKCYPVTYQCKAMDSTGTVKNWQWDMDGKTGKGTTISKSFDAPGDYYVKLIANPDSGSYNIVKFIHVTDEKNPVASFAVSDNKVINSELSFTNASQNIDSSFWDFGDGSFSNEMSLKHTYSYAGEYKITLHAYNQYGCESETEQTVAVRCNKIMETDFFTPNGDGKNDCFGFETLNVCGVQKIEIYNIWGGLVFQTTDPSESFCGKDLPCGVYYYSVKYFEGEQKGIITLER